MELNCLIVDDEPLALDLMESYVKRTPFLKLVARCSNALEVLQVLREEAVDLIFLDIQMPELNGLELSRVLDKQPPSNSMLWKVSGWMRWTIY